MRIVDPAPMLIKVVYFPENLELMRELPEEAIDLIYIGLPFFSNQQYEGIQMELRTVEQTLS